MNKTIILEVLNACASAGYSLPKNLLKTQVQSHCGGARIGDNDFDADLNALLDGGLVATRRAPVTGDTLYFITGPGKTALAQ
jgi:hypothetical protein